MPPLASAATAPISPPAGSTIELLRVAGIAGTPVRLFADHGGRHAGLPWFSLDDLLAMLKPGAVHHRLSSFAPAGPCA